MTNINSKSILTDASSFETYQNLLPQYSFKKQGRAYRAGSKGGVVLKENRNGLLCAYFPNGDYKGGTVASIAAQVFNLDFKSDYQDIYQKVCEAASLDFSKYCSDAPSDYTPQATLSVSKPIETKAFLPNSGEVKVSSTVKFAEKNSFAYKAAAEFYKKKTGVTDLAKFNVYPLQELNYLGNTGEGKNPFKIYFNHKTIGLGYFGSGLNSNAFFKSIDAKTGKRKAGFAIQATGQKNKVFGLNNLPTENRQSFTLVICEGEDDTNAINANLHEFGFCSITFGGASSSIPIDFIQSLGFKSIFCLLDNDKTGLKAAIRNATAAGLPYISIKDHYSDLKDVCDIYKKHGVTGLVKLCEIETQNKTVEKTNFERIGYNLHNVLNINIEKYLSEKLPQLTNYLLRYRKLLLQSPTDTGKTLSIVKLAQDPIFYKNMGIESIVLAVPRLFLCDQLKEVFMAKTGIVPSIITGKSTITDLQEAHQSKVIVCTYDSLKKMESHLKDCLLVIDEIHLLTDDTGFRSEVTAKVFELIPKAKRVLGLTATPNFEMCVGMQLDERFIPDEIREALDFTLCKVSLTKNQTKKLQLNCYPKSRINAVTDYAENIASGSEKAAVLLNDVKVLETVAEVINSKYSESTATILSSKKAAYNVENPTYQAITKSEAVPIDNRLFLGTNILTAGISLNFAVENLAIFGNLDSRTITQFSARPRLKDDVNKSLDVDLFKTVSKSDFDAILSDFEQCNIETSESLKDRKNAIEWLQSDIIKATGTCEDANKLDKSNKIRRKYFDELGSIYFDESTNEWKPNLPSIIFNHNGRIERRLTIYGKLLKAKQYDSTFEILPPQYVSFDKNKQATEILEDKKEVAKEVKSLAFEVFSENKNACFELAYKQSNDYELKENIKTEITVFKELSNKAKDIKTSYPSVIDTLPMIAGRYFDLKGASTCVAEITPKKTLNMLTNVQKESEYQLLKNRIISLSELRSLKNETLTNAEKIRALRSEMIIGKIRDFKKSKRRDWMTKGEMIKLVVDKRRIDFKEAKMRISELFEVSSKRLPNGGGTVYLIGHRLTLDSVIENALNQSKTAAKNSLGNASNLGQNKGEICRIENTHKALINN